MADSTVTCHIEYSPKANSKHSTHQVGDWRIHPYDKDLSEAEAVGRLKWCRDTFHYNNYRAVKTVSTQTILDW
jgi:hypothetical protein